MELQYEIERRLVTARFAALRAGRLTYDYFLKGVPADTKKDLTPVTVADREAEELLRDQFQRQFPGDGFLGEEYGEEPSKTGFRWIIDPIDATANFIRAIPIFATLIGLEYQDELVAGVVYMPALDHLYYAGRGMGAFRNDRPIRVSTINRLEQAQLIYSSLEYFDQAKMTDGYLRLVRQIKRSRGFGDFYGFLLIADGSADIMVDPVVSPWDVAALVPIIQEAGGTFTDVHGKPTIYGQGALATNKILHEPAFAALHDREQEIKSIPPSHKGI